MQMVRLSNNVPMPAIGLGVYDPTGPDKTAAAVESAIKCGYRLIDTAAAYNNERQVAEGIRRSGIDRRELFITTKLWMTDHGDVRSAVDASLRRLGTSYLDLYLIHWPQPAHFEATITAWRTMAELVAEKRIRAIGVSNFHAKHIEALIDHTKFVPNVNQIELHPLFVQEAMRTFNARFRITTEAWAPLGAGNLLANPLIAALGRKYDKTPAQIVLRWHMQNGIIPIPKSSSPERIAQNINVFDFAMTPDEIAFVSALDTGKRSSPDPDAVHAGTWPVRVAA